MLHSMHLRRYVAFSELQQNGPDLPVVTWSVVVLHYLTVDDRERD